MPTDPYRADGPSSAESADEKFASLLAIRHAAVSAVTSGAFAVNHYNSDQLFFLA